MKFLFFSRYLFVSLLLFFPSVYLRSDSATWTGNGGDQNWSNTNNWTAPFPNAANDIASFNLPTQSTVLTAPIIVNSIEITGAAFQTLNIRSQNNGTLTIAAGAANPRINFVNSQILNFNTVNFQNTPVSLDTRAVAFNITNSQPSTFAGVSFGSGVSGNAENVGIGDGANFIQVYLSGTWSTSGANARMTVFSGSTLTLGPGVSGNINDFDVTVNPGASLTGQGVIRNNLNINGTFSPGQANEVVYINCASDITFGPNSRYQVQLNHTSATDWSASSASALGNFNADGTVGVTPGKGIYTTNQSTFIGGAAGLAGESAFAGNFTLAAEDSADWQITQTLGPNGSANLSPTRTIMVPPVPTSQLVGHTQEVAAYLQQHLEYVATQPSLLQNLREATISDDTGYKNALTAMSPLVHASTSNAQHQALGHVAHAVNRKYYRYRGQYRNYEDNYPTYGIPLTGVFIEPIGIFYHQESTGSLPDSGHIGFMSYTYGTMIGGTKVIGQNLFAKTSIGYTNSNLIWNSHFGNAKASTLYLAPQFGWFNERAFGNVMVLGNMNFHVNHRRIVVQALENIAKSRYKSYTLVLRGNGGFRQPLGAGFWFQPDFTFLYTTFFTNGFKESGAPGLDLEVKSNIVYTLQPSIRARFIKEFYTPKFCYAPCLYLGALANIPVGENVIRSRFRDAPSTTLFNVQGYNKSTYQLIAGSELYAQRFEKFILSSHFEADLLSHLEVYLVRIKMEWLF